MRLIKIVCFFSALIFSSLVFAGLSASNFTFNPQYDDSLGFLFNTTYSQLLTPNNAGLLEGDFGNNEYRIAATWGYKLTLAQRIKLTFERLAQRIDYNFDSGSVKHWNAQNAFGGDYEILLPQQHLNALDFSGYYAKADSTQLSPVIFANNTLINYRNIAGATSKGVAAGINFSLWKNALLNTTANYDDLYYRTLYQPADNSSGLGETVSLEQLLSPSVKLKLLQSHREIYDQYEAGLSWLIPVHPTTRLELGFDVSHFASNTALGNDNRYGIKLGYQWDLPENNSNVYAAPDATQPDLASWTATPAVHMAQVLTTVDQKTVALVSQQPGLLKATANVAADPNAPQPTGQKIPDVNQSIANPNVSFQIDTENYFTNPLVKNRAMTFSFGQNCSSSQATGCLPSNISTITSHVKPDGYYVYTISGVADNQNVLHGTYNIDVYADNGIQAGPITFGITITPTNTGPIYNGKGMPNGEYGQTYSYDLTQDFTASGATTITAVSGLPIGLSLSGNKVVGQPQQAGVIPLTVTAQANGISIQQPINLTIVPHYQGTGMPSGEVNQSYNYDLHADFLPNNVTIAVTGNLPAGLQNNNGAISGTPTVSGTFPLQVVATVNGASTAPTQINLQIDPAGTNPVYNGPANLPVADAMLSYSYNLQSQFSPAGVTVTVDASSLPAGLAYSNGIISGTPTKAGTYPLKVTASLNGKTITPSISLTVNTSTGTLECPYAASGTRVNYKVCAVINGLPSNTCYTFKGDNVAGETLYSSNANSNTFSCNYGFNSLNPNQHIQISVNNGVVNGGGTCSNGDSSTCKATITYGQ